MRGFGAAGVGRGRDCCRDFRAGSLEPLNGQARAGGIPRVNGKPDLNGLWQAVNTANWDIQAHTAKAALAMRPGPVVPVPAKEVIALGAAGAVPSGAGVVEGDELPYTADGAQEETGEPAELAVARSGDQVLSPRRAARDLHAVPVPDHPEQRGRVHVAMSTRARCGTST